ncbi:hypothetical protein [Natronolimnohabitans innermongolicus]|uniref:Uncharacterized protein n=1 Tax=Natronolimnohabitans innermongolicus JCM 12255 TaxID=1227499 RepID=L9XIK2_9EURY|nr:hypothetical protein [Natronolimnohabitans innermongolicus]ELY61564.1 hypothetical protein C493_01831 [Natronolimnohabitans innermongolicus JCM 12255]
MTWQDLVFLACSLLTIIALFPALRNLNAQIPLRTSLPQFGLAVVYTATFYSLGMTFSAAGLFGTAVMWSLIAHYRSPNGVLPIAASSMGAASGSTDRTAVTETTAQQQLRNDNNRF